MLMIEGLGGFVEFVIEVITTKVLCFGVFSV